MKYVSDSKQSSKHEAFEATFSAPYESFGSKYKIFDSY